jgi:hypothetical protein
VKLTSKSPDIRIGAKEAYYYNDHQSLSFFYIPVPTSTSQSRLYIPRLTVEAIGDGSMAALTTTLDMGGALPLQSRRRWSMAN